MIVFLFTLRAFQILLFLTFTCVKGMKEISTLTFTRIFYTNTNGLWRELVWQSERRERCQLHVSPTCYHTTAALSVSSLSPLADNVQHPFCSAHKNLLPCLREVVRTAAATLIPVVFNSFLHSNGHWHVRRKRNK